MRLELTGRHVAITPATRALVERRLAHTLRLLNDGAVSAHVVLSRERARIKAEVTLHARRDRFLHGEASGASPGPAVNAAAARIDRQARRLKGKATERRRRGPSVGGAASLAAEEQAAAAQPRQGSAPRRRIIRAKRYAVKPMSVEDAAAEMGDGRDTFLVFRNSMTDSVTVLFRRPDGHFGLIEPES